MFSQECVSIGGCGNKGIEVKVIIEAAKLTGVEITEDFYLKVVDKVYNKGAKEVVTEKSTMEISR